MFAYSTTTYPTYYPPAPYPLAHYIVVPSVPTARERYIRAVAEAQSARARYLSELEERHILASLQEQEALRLAEIRQRRIIASQTDIAHRRVRHACAQSIYPRPAVYLQGRRQAFARGRRENFPPALEQRSPLTNLDEIISALISQGDEKYMWGREKEKVTGEEAREGDILKGRVRFVRRVDPDLTATQADQNPPTSQPLQPSANDPPVADPAHEHAARAIQHRWRTRSADIAARNDAVATIATLRARFLFIKNTFSFPEHLDFKEQIADQEQEAPTLLFTQANAAVHAYIHELTKLLTLADAVPSHGSHQVREQRRSFVRLVEKALDSVDRRVATVWRNRIKASTILRSGTDALETVPKVVASESVARPSEPNISGSAMGVDSTATDSKSLKSSSIDTFTTSPITTNVDLPTFSHQQASEALSQDATFQDVPSKSMVLNGSSKPDEPLDIRPDAVTVGPTGEDHDVDAQAKLKIVDSIQNTRVLDAAEAPSSSTVSHSQASETSSVTTVASVEATAVDVVPTSGEIDSTSRSSVPGLNTAQPFDVVYPDSSPSSPLVAQSDVDFQEPTQVPSISNEKISPRLGEVENKGQNDFQSAEEEEESFELL